MANQNSKNNALINRKKNRGEAVNSSKAREAHGHKPYKSGGNPFKRLITYPVATGRLVPVGSKSV